MKNFIVLFREPDGRTQKQTKDDIESHQLNWKSWLEKWGNEGKQTGGTSLHYLMKYGTRVRRNGC